MSYCNDKYGSLSIPKMLEMIEVRDGLLREHLTAPDTQKISEWQDLSKRTIDAIGEDNE